MELGICVNDILAARTAGFQQINKVTNFVDNNIRQILLCVGVTQGPLEGVPGARNA